jgi:hypothetical protein
MRAVTESPDLLRELKTAARERIAHFGVEQTADGVLRGVEAVMSS